MFRQQETTARHAAGRETTMLAVIMSRVAARTEIMRLFSGACNDTIRRIDDESGLSIVLSTHHPVSVVLSTHHVSSAQTVCVLVFAASRATFAGGWSGGRSPTQEP